MIVRPQDYLVRLRPRGDTLYASQSRTVLATDRDGFIRGGADHGLIVHQTRLLSLYRYLINDKPPRPVALSNVEQHTWLGYYVALPPGVEEERDPGSGQMEVISQQTLELRLSRYVGDGFHEDVDLTNFTQRRTEFTLTLELEPGGTWHACLDLIPFIDGRWLRTHYGCRSFAGTHNEYDRRRKIFLSEATRFTAPQSETLTHVVTGALEQARRDLAALRLYDLDRGERAWTTSAGLPIFLALFGRDALTTAWQAAPLGPEMMKGALPELARRQGRVVNDWRDEQPGKMLHEAHTGPTKMLDISARRRYYGSITTSGFYPVAVSELWHWTGDKELIRPLVEPAMNALKWLDRYGDLDGDGFYEYLTRSEQGVKHQAWKDSADAVVYEDGSQVEPPIATCEEQGFAYLAKLHMSEVLWWLDEKDAAKRLFREAEELKKRFNEAFWMEDEGFFALGLDAQKRQIKSITSNPGHCLATAIVDEGLVPRTALRFIADDLFSGWGVRTLSSKHPAYNPYSYHRGSVWPVEQGTFAVAFKRYGYHRVVELIAQAQFEAAALFDFCRLPELFSGHQRDADHPFPALYPQANSPQAWSASAVFCLLQAMLGLYPYAPLNMLLVDPHMPEWLPEITLRNLRVGDATVTIRFFRREGGGGDYEVLDKRGRLHVLRQPSPWSLTASFAERLKDVLTSLLPGKGYERSVAESSQLR